MSPYDHFVLSVILMIYVCVLCFALIELRPQDQEQSTFIYKLSFWKKIDLLWYSAALLTLFIVALSISENNLLVRSNDIRQKMLADMRTVEEIRDDVVQNCERMNNPNTRFIAISNKAFDSEMEKIIPECRWLSNIRFDFYLAKTRSITHEVLREEIDPYDNVFPTKLKVSDTDWSTVIARIKDTRDDLDSLVTRANSVVLSPDDDQFPDGARLDQQQQTLASISDQLSTLSPFRFQGFWWLYLFAFLIGLKPSKTFAELRLSAK